MVSLRTPLFPSTLCKKVLLLDPSAGQRVILGCIVFVSLVGTMSMFGKIMTAEDDQSARQAGRQLAQLLRDSGDQLE